MTFTRIALGGMAMTCPVAALADAPNILLSSADDMGHDGSFCYALGDQQVPMPNMETMCDHYCSHEHLRGHLADFFDAD